MAKTWSAYLPGELFPCAFGYTTKSELKKEIKFLINNDLMESGIKLEDIKIVQDNYTDGS